MCIVLITGGAGFIGVHLAERLLDEGHRVIVLDNLQTGSKDNICHLFDNPCFQFLQHDVTLPYNIDSDFIYNLACPASPAHYQCSPVQTSETCALGAINALRLAKKTGARVLQASSSEVYGNPEVHPQTELYRGHASTTSVRSCYSEGKRFSETLFLAYQKELGVDIRIARIFNTYGPRMRPDDGRAISNFVLQAITGQPVTVYGDGTQTRSFCYVTDMVEGLIRLMNTDGVAWPINLGNPDEHSILEVAELIVRMTTSKSKTVLCPAVEDDPILRKPDISMARNLLSWKPTVSLEKGLASVIQYFRTQVVGTSTRPSCNLG